MDRGLLSWWRRHPDLSALLFLALMALLLMSPYLFRPEVIVWPRSALGTDLLNYRWAHVFHLRQSLQRDGQIPLWRPSTLGGEPMIGNPAVMLAYPLQLLMALLPIPVFAGFAWLTALHLWIAGVGIWVLVRHTLGLGRLASLLSALAMTLTPRLSSYAVGDVGIDYALCWVPLTLAWASLALQRRRLLWVILVGIGLAAQYLLHIQVCFYALWVLGLLIAYHALLAAWTTRSTEGWRGLLREVRRSVWPLALALPVFAGLVAFQLLPSIGFLPHLSRASMSLSRADAYALPPVLLVSALFPCPLRFTEWELYVGLLPLLLIPWAAVHPRRDQAAFWFGIALLSVLFSLGSAMPLYAWLYRYLPGFRWLRVPVRAWFMVSIAAALFLGMAVDVLAKRSPSCGLRRRERLWLVAGGWTLAVSTITGRWIAQHGQESDWLLGVVGSLGMALASVGIWLWAKKRIRLGTLGAMLGLGLLLDLLPVDAAYMQAMPVEEAFEMPEVGRTLLTPQVRAQEPFRVYTVRDEVPDHVAVREGLELVEGLSSFQFARYVTFARLATGCTLPGFAATVPPCTSNELSATAYLDAVPDPVLLGAFNVRYVLTPLPLDEGWTLVQSVGGRYIYENDRVMPRVFAVGRAEVVHSEQALWQRLSEVDLRTTALLESGVQDVALPRDPFYADAQLRQRSPNNLQIEVDMPGDGILVLAEVWTPGWHATDNGRSTQVLRVNGTMRGLLLAAGRHDVQLRFRPQTMVWGTWIAALTGLGSAVILIGELRSTRIHGRTGLFSQDQV